MKKIIAFYIFILCTLTVNAQLVFIKNDKYGLKDSAGDLIKAKFDNIDDFNDGINTYVHYVQRKRPI